MYQYKQNSLILPVWSSRAAWHGQEQVLFDRLRGRGYQIDSVIVHGEQPMRTSRIQDAFALQSQCLLGTREKDRSEWSESMNEFKTLPECCTGVALAAMVAETMLSLLPPYGRSRPPYPALHRANRHRWPLSRLVRATPIATLVMCQSHTVNPVESESPLPVDSKNRTRSYSDSKWPRPVVSMNVCAVAP
jgi:hypothetical protein